jgi:hypothetical protein
MQEAARTDVKVENNNSDIVPQKEATTVKEE